ncbi:MAG: hypothetical protein KIS96_11980 [Bauldia sp.]|nr:hypothetical protein [Bauldia sp.]
MKKQLLVAAMMFSLATAAFAADIAPVLPPAPPPPAPAPVFSWDRSYVGVGIGGAWFDFPSQEFHVTAYFGHNFAVGSRAVVGAEVYATWWTPAATPWRIGAEARVGVLINPRLLAYGAVGVAHYGAGNNYLTLGPGIEFAVSDSLSLDIAYDFERGLNTTATGHRVTASLNWHFGR